MSIKEKGEGIMPWLRRVSEDSEDRYVRIEGRWDRMALVALRLTEKDLGPMSYQDAQDLLARIKKKAMELRLQAQKA